MKKVEPVIGDLSLGWEEPFDAPVDGSAEPRRPDGTVMGFMLSLAEDMVSSEAALTVPRVGSATAPRWSDLVTAGGASPAEGAGTSSPPVPERTAAMASIVEEQEKQAAELLELRAKVKQLEAQLQARHSPEAQREFTEEG